MSRAYKGNGWLPIIATFIIVFALMFLVVYNSVAQAQGFTLPIILQCNTTDAVLKMLKEKFREVTTGGGASGREHVRLFESHDVGEKQTWTLVISNPNGLSCIIKGGQDWITDPAITKGDPT